MLPLIPKGSLDLLLPGLAGNEKNLIGLLIVLKKKVDNCFFARWICEINRVDSWKVPPAIQVPPT